MQMRCARSRAYGCLEDSCGAWCTADKLTSMFTGTSCGVHISCNVVKALWQGQGQLYGSLQARNTQSGAAIVLPLPFHHFSLLDNIGRGTNSLKGWFLLPIIIIIIIMPKLIFTFCNTLYLTSMYF